MNPRPRRGSAPAARCRSASRPDHRRGTGGVATPGPDDRLDRGHGRRRRRGRALTAIVTYFEHLMEFGLATVEVPGVADRLVVQTPAHDHHSAGDRVTMSAPPERVYLFDEAGDRIR